MPAPRGAGMLPAALKPTCQQGTQIPDDSQLGIRSATHPNPKGILHQSPGLEQPRVVSNRCNDNPS
jgi:hypothetical protein